MPLKISHPSNFYTGLLLLLSAGFFIYLGRALPLGSSTSMGAGYFPFYVSILQGLVGSVLVAKGIVAAGPPLLPVNLRAPIVVIGSLVIFGLMLERLGLAFSGFAAVMLASSAVPVTSWWRVVALAVVASAFVCLIFIFGLGLPIPLLPRI